MQKTIRTTETFEAKAGRYNISISSTNGGSFTGLIMVEGGAGFGARDFISLSSAEVEGFRAFFKELT